VNKDKETLSSDISQADIADSDRRVSMLNANIENLRQNVYNLSRRLIAFCQLHPEAGRAKENPKDPVNPV